MPKRISKTTRRVLKQMRRMNKYADLYAKMIDPNATGVIIYSYLLGAAYEIEIFGADGNTLEVHTVGHARLMLQRSTNERR